MRKKSRITHMSTSLLGNLTPFLVQKMILRRVFERRIKSKAVFIVLHVFVYEQKGARASLRAGPIFRLMLKYLKSFHYH